MVFMPFYALLCLLMRFMHYICVLYALFRIRMGFKHFEFSVLILTPRLFAHTHTPRLIIFQFLGDPSPAY